MLPLLREAAIPIDALVGSANDADERYTDGDLDPPPRIVVATDGARGGTFTEYGTTARYAPVTTQLTGDTYGAGDTFAAALTYAFGEGSRTAAAVDAAAARAGRAAVAWAYPPR